MTSSVFFKFKSQKEPSRVEFDGTGISVFDLKRDIIIKSGLGDGTEFDLAIYNEDGNEEYDDDTTIIPRSTSIIARRLPPLKAGAGRAARYMSGKMPANAKNSFRKEQAVSKSTGKQGASTSGALKLNGAMTEEERMAAMFQAQSEQWSAQQEELATQTPVFRPGGSKKGGPPPNVPDHEPPTGYICYRCGEKGHWIQVCPTNDDPTFDNKPRVKRTTGIPRSFLKTVEKPMALSNDGTVDDTKAPSGIMVNAEGEFVIAEPDKASWEQFQAKTKTSAAAQRAAASGDKELQDRGLECSVDKRMFIDPMKTPCCEKTYCNDCITNALIESDFTCPNCGTDEVLIDDLKPDEEMSAKIKAYINEKDATKKETKNLSVKPEEIKLEESGTPESISALIQEKNASPSPPLISLAAVKSPKSPSPESKPEAQGVNGPPSVAKKRLADEILENPKIPKGPKAMQQQEAGKEALLQKQQQQQQQQQQQAMMNGMNSIAGFPNIPMGFDMSQQLFGPNGIGIGMTGFNTMNGYGMGMPGSMTMPPMMGMGTSMMNPMMGMNGFSMNGGFPNMNGMGMAGPGIYGNGLGYGGNLNGMGMGANGPALGGSNSHSSNTGGFPNQQKTVFAAPLPNEEDNAYFRKPVNPHRHQGRQRRARPSDYREL